MQNKSLCETHWNMNYKCCAPKEDCWKHHKAPGQLDDRH